MKRLRFRMKRFKGTKPSREAKLNRYYAFDIECAGLNPKDPLLLCVVPLESYTKVMQENWVFTTREELQEFLHNLPTGFNHTFFAHNGSKFDIYAVFDSALDIVNSDKFAVKGRIYSIKYLNNITFRDSSHLLAAPLKVFGAKGITPEKFINPNHPQYGRPDCITDQDIAYCIQDCIVLRDALNSLRDMYRGWINQPNAKLPMTLSSMSHRIWSHKYWPEEWRWIREAGRRKGDSEMSTFICEDAEASARLSYYGGRTQIIGEMAKEYENVASFDCNSMYPTQMLEELPDPTSSVCFDFKWFNNVRKSGKLYWGKFKMSGKGARGFLPAVNTDGRRDFTVDSFDGYLCSPEVEWAIENGWIIEDGEHLFYAERTISPFKEFVNDFYKIRQDMRAVGDGREILVKLILNGLYGKFGQDGSHDIIESYSEVMYLIENGKQLIDDNGILIGYTDEDGREWEIKHWGPHVDQFYLEAIESSEIPEHSCFQWVAFITSYARVYLDAAIKAMQDADYEVVYCDTDSVHVANYNIDKPVPIAIGKALGQWDLEGVSFSDNTYYPFAAKATYYEPKVYTWVNENGCAIKIKHKGCNRSDGDPTKEQTNDSVVQYRMAVRRDLDAGSLIQTIKKSKRHYKGD